MQKKTKVYVGMDVHKDTVMMAVLPAGARAPTLVKRLSHDPRGLRRLLDRLARQHEVRACYEASGAGYVLERMIRGWGHKCGIVARSLIPRRPGEQRKDAEDPFLPGFSSPPTTSYQTLTATIGALRSPWTISRSSLSSTYFVLAMSTTPSDEAPVPATPPLVLPESCS